MRLWLKPSSNRSLKGLQWWSTHGRSNHRGFVGENLASVLPCLRSNWAPLQTLIKDGFHHFGESILSGDTSSNGSPLMATDWLSTILDSYPSSFAPVDWSLVVWIRIRRGLDSHNFASSIDIALSNQLEEYNINIDRCFTRSWQDSLGFSTELKWGQRIHKRRQTSPKWNGYSPKKCAHPCFFANNDNF